MSEIRILRQIPEGIMDPMEIIFSIVNYEKKVRGNPCSPFPMGRSPRIYPVSLQHYSLEGLKKLMEDILKALDEPVIEWERPKIVELIEY